MQYLPPRRQNTQFNVGDFEYQDQYITYGELKRALAGVFTSVNKWVSSQYFASKLYLQMGSGIHIVDSNIDISPTQIGYLNNINTNIQAQMTTNTYVPTTGTTTTTATRNLLGQYTDVYFTATDFNTYYKGDIMTSSYDGKYVSFCGKSTLYISSNYGVSFLAQTNATSGIIYYSIQMSVSGQYQVAVSQGISASNIYVSNNYGITFVSIQSISIANSGRWGMTIVISATGKFISVGGGGGAGIQSYYSNNYGSTFVIYGNIYNRVSAVLIENKIISLSSFNSNIITVSPLTSTSEVETASNSFLDAIRLCANASGTVVIIISNSGTKYWISTDSGVSFLEKAGFPMSLIYAKFMDNMLYLVSSTGYVYKSTDYGVSFTTSNTGLTIQCFSVNSYGFMMLTTDGKLYKGYDPPGISPIYIYPSLKLQLTGVNTEYVSDKFKFELNTGILYINSNSVSTASASPGAYFMIPGVSTFPIFSSINDFSALEMYPYITSDHDSIILLPSYALYIFSEVNQGGKYLSLGNRTANVEYYPISSAYRIKSCVLYRYDTTLEAYAEVLSVSNVQKTSQTWN